MGYLRPHQVEEIENEKRTLQRTLETKAVQDRGNAEAHIRRIDRELEQKAPPELTPEQRDQAVKECRMIEERLVPMMPSDEEMRRNPAGVTGRHMRYERVAKARDRFPEGEIFRWKNNQLALNRGDDDPDIANFERLRPLHNHGSMLGAQIPGKTFVGTNPSPQYLEGYDRTFGTNGEEVTSIGDNVDTFDSDPTEERRVAVRRKKKAPVQAKPKTPMPCGKLMGPYGRHFHVAKCETCREAQKE